MHVLVYSQKSALCAYASACTCMLVSLALSVKCQRIVAGTVEVQEGPFTSTATNEPNFSSLFLLSENV